MSEKQPRPGQATLAGSLIIGGSVIVILSAWHQISTLHTLDGQERLQRMLGDSGDNWGLTVDGLATTLRVLCLIGAGAAAASAILGFQVFQRANSARIVLTVLSPLLLVGGLATNQFLAPMVLAGIAMLWLQPTRDWYAGRPWVQAYEERRAARLASMRSASPTVPKADPFATPVVPPAATPGPVDVQTSVTGAPATVPFASSAPPPLPPRTSRPVRPAGLVTACVLAWVTSTVVVVGLALIALTVGRESDQLFADLKRQQPDLVESSGMTESGLVASMYVVLGGLLVWALIAIVLAGLTFIGQNWARITLVVSSSCAGVLALVMCLAAPPLVVLVLILAVSTWLLLRSDVAAWFRR